jgi:RNA polymerase sigma-70 factor (ECF subfamily)
MPEHAPAPQAAELPFEMFREIGARLVAAAVPEVVDPGHACSDATEPKGGSYDLIVEAATDERLIRAARTGDLDAFAEFVRRYERRVRAVLFRILDDERDVEETTQDTFVQAWRSLDRFRGEAAAFTWLYRIAVNEALMRRRRKRLPTVELDEFTERGPAAAGAPKLEDAAEVAELREFLLARIKALPFEYRAPLVLRDVEGLSNEQVADALGLSLAAAKSRIHRARMQIRAELERWSASE